jgi:hypothetical protein
MTQKESKRMESWLTSRGLRANPFGRWSADHDQHLPKYFVDIGGFDEMLRAQGPCIIFAGRGCGKTAQRQMLATQCRPADRTSTRLAIPYTYASFGPLLDKANEALDDLEPMDHVAALLTTAIKIVAEMQATDPRLLRSPTVAATVSKELSELESHLALYLHGARGAAPAHNGGLTALDALEKFGALVQTFGIETCVVLVDGLDESLKTVGRPVQTAAFLAPLLGTPPLIECPGWAFKFYLPWELKPVLYSCPWFRADRLERLDSLSWNENLLSELLRERLIHHSLRQPPYEDLAQLCEDDLALVIDNELVSLAGPSPRAALYLANALLQAHAAQASPPERIARHTWDRVKTSWEERSADYCLQNTDLFPSSFSVPVLTRPTTQAPGPPLLHLDLDKVLVWVGRHEIRKAIKSQDHAVLVCLWNHRDGITSKEVIAREAWSEDESEGVSDQAIAAAIARVRRVLEVYAPGWEYIETVRSSRREQGGYRLHTRGTAKAARK